jgi:hypothetical protein
MLAALLCDQDRDLVGGGLPQALSHAAGPPGLYRPQASTRFEVLGLRDWTAGWLISVLTRPAVTQASSCCA